MGLRILRRASPSRTLLRKTLGAAAVATAILGGYAATATPRHAPPSVLFGPLFDRVALSERFPDGKSWADATPIAPPASIMRDYRRLSPKTNEALRHFVDARFILDSGAPAMRKPPTGLSLRAHIESLWPILRRKSAGAPQYTSLLQLPHPYIVPGGRFTEVYYWDSYFTMLGFGAAQNTTRRHMVDNFADLIRRFGHVPNGNRTYYLSRSQPPFFFKMVELTDPANPRRAYARYLGALRAEHRWWMKGETQVKAGSPAGRVVRMPDGSILNRYWDDRDAPRDESYKADVQVAAGAPDKRRVFRDLRAAAESGWDFSSRWLTDAANLSTIRTGELVPPDLNSILFGLERAIAQGCAELKDRGCIAEFRGRAAARERAMRTFLWNGQSGLFDDYSWRSGRRAGNVTAASLYPLFFGMATRHEAERIADTVERELLKPGGLVTTNRTTGQQWDSPNGWAPLQWVAVQGLRSYGHDRLAEAVARRWLGTIATVYAGTGKLLEKYDVVTPRPGGGGEYPLQDGFGWTNGVTIALLKLYPDMAAGKAAGRRTGTVWPRPVPVARNPQDRAFPERSGISAP